MGVNNSHGTSRHGKYNTLDMSTIIVNNQSNQNLGTVTFSTVNSSQTASVGPSQVDTFSLPFVAASFAINSSTCSYPDTVVVPLASGAKIQVEWTSPGLISVLDYDQQN